MNKIQNRILVFKKKSYMTRGTRFKAKDL